jgi:hypothetical protein
MDGGDEMDEMDDMDDMDRKYAGRIRVSMNSAPWR